MDGGRGVIGGEVGGEAVAFQGHAANGDERGRFPAVAAEQRDVDAQLPRLQGDQAGLGVVAGDKYDFGAGGLDGGELGVEILVAAAVFFLVHNFAAAGEELFLEEFGEAEAVVAFHIGEDGGGMGLEGLGGEVGHDRALEGINKTDAENVIAHLGDLGIGGGRGDHGNAALLADGRGFEGTGGRDFAEHGDHAVAGDQFTNHGGGLAGLGLVVFGVEFDFLAEHAAGGVDFIHRLLDAFMGGLAEGGLGAGQGAVFAHLDDVAAGIGAGRRLIATGEQAPGSHDCQRKKLSTPDIHKSSVFGSHPQKLGQA